MKYFILSLKITLLVFLVSVNSLKNEYDLGYSKFYCPTASGYFPHFHCWQFWQCGNWIAYEMTCPAGTQWDQEILTCNFLTTCRLSPCHRCNWRNHNSWNLHLKILLSRLFFYWWVQLKMTSIHTMIAYLQQPDHLFHQINRIKYWKNIFL